MPRPRKSSPAAAESLVDTDASAASGALALLEAEPLDLAPKDLSGAWRAAFDPPDRRPIYEWAADNLELPRTLALSGRFDVSISNHFRAPFHDLQDDRVRKVSVLAPPRSGKTLIGDIWNAWVIVNDPGSFLTVFNDEQLVKEHAESRCWPILESCEKIRQLLPLNRHLHRTTEIIFAHMPLYLKGPAIGKLQSKGIRYLQLDEPWRYKAGVMTEADARQGDFEKLGNDKRLAISQGGEETSDWALDCERFARFEWTVPCEGCGKHFAPLFTGKRDDGSYWGVTWDQHKDERGDWLISRCLPSVRFHCPHCHHAHLDTPRTKSFWNNAGQYALESEPNAERHLYHWESVIDVPWHKLVEQWLHACNMARRGAIEGKIQFNQKRRARHCSTASIETEQTQFSRLAYEITSTRPDKELRFMTCDKQLEGLYWVQIRDWKPGGESRRVWFGQCFGEGGLVDKAKEWNVNQVFVDCAFGGGRRDHDWHVYAMVARHQWIALRGSDEDSFTHVELDKGVKKTVRRPYSERQRVATGQGTAQQGKGRDALMYHFSSSAMNFRVRGLIKSGLWIEPQYPPGQAPKWEKEYNAQMSSVYLLRKIDKVSGKPKMVWATHGKDDHANDTAKMQCVAASLAKLLPDTLEEESGHEPEEQSHAE